VAKERPVADPPSAPDSRDDAGVGPGGESMRQRRHRVAALWIILVKAIIVATILVLPSGLTISLGAAHDVALLVLLLTAALVLMVWRPAAKTLKSALSHRWPHRHRSVPARRWPKARIGKDRGHK
jgi:hypothetical protein